MSLRQMRPQHLAMDDQSLRPPESDVPHPLWSSARVAITGVTRHVVHRRYEWRVIQPRQAEQVEPQVPLLNMHNVGLPGVNCAHDSPYFKRVERVTQSPAREHQGLDFGLQHVAQSVQVV